MKKFLFFALLALPAIFAVPATDSRFAEVERLMKAARRAMLIPGMAVTVVEHDQIAWSGADGLADLEQQVLATPETVWRIASVSKPVAATATMQLVEQGKVKLDEPIWTYLPWYPRKGDAVITVRNILTHTSGIRHYDYEAGEKESAEYFPTVEAGSHVNGVDREPLQFTPGTKYLYSSYAYLLLAGIVERASGLSYEAWLREKIFAPAGMKSSSLDRNREIVAHRARFYRKTDSGTAVVNAPYVDNSYKWAAGGVLATADDLARFAMALDTGKLLGVDTLKFVYTENKLTDRKPTGYGLGWHVSTDQDGRLWAEHSGGATGGAAYLLRCPSEGLAIAILCNLERPGDLKKLSMEMARAVTKSAK